MNNKTCELCDDKNIMLEYETWFEYQFCSSSNNHHYHKKCIEKFIIHYLSDLMTNRRTLDYEKGLSDKMRQSESIVLSGDYPSNIRKYKPTIS